VGHLRLLLFYMYMHVICVSMAIQLPCYCASLRQATRLLSQIYDASLRDSGLTVAQFTLLTVLERLPSSRINDLALALATDQTTLSRTLRLMERDSLISEGPGEDLRESRWRLTGSGRRKLQRARPRWKAAQKTVKDLIGVKEAARLQAVTARLTARLTR
jgi:DNA-binding MarR family transcriptional regulator